MNSPEVIEFLARTYSERLIGCIENVTNKSCTLTHKEKRQAIKQMISTEHAKQSYKQTRPKSFMMKVMLVPYKWQNVALVCSESKVISFVMKHFTNLFARLKSNR